MKPHDEKYTYLVYKENLSDYVSEVFRNFGLDNQSSTLAADVLVTADLRGISSHGCRRLPNFYIPLLKRGLINPTASPDRFQVVETIVRLNANNGLGLALAPLAMKSAIDIAQNYGLGFVWMINSTHFGSSSYYTLKAAQSGMLGIVLTNGYPAVSPTGFNNPIFGTNSISIGCPNGDVPIIMDLSLSSISLGGLEDAAINGQNIPIHFAAQSIRKKYGTNSNDDIDPNILLKNRMIAPWGSNYGSLGEHKGVVFSLMSELLTAIISGGQMSFQLNKGGACHFFGVINPEKIHDLKEIQNSLITLQEKFENNSRSSLGLNYYIPGEKSQKIYNERSIKGIPFREQTIEALSKLENELNVQVKLKWSKVENV